MDINDYLLDHSEIEWPEVLSAWHWLLPTEITIWFMNRFGDLFLVQDDDTVHMLDVGIGTLKQVAESQEQFTDLLEEGDNANQWLMVPLIDGLNEAGMVLDAGQCYGYKKLPVFGGEYSIDNTCVLTIEEHFSFTGSIHEQIKDLPDGAEVQIEIIDKAEEE